MSIPGHLVSARPGIMLFANGATLTKGTNGAATDAAVLVSDAASGTTITGCGVKGTINNGTAGAITLSSNMITTNGGTTVSGTYLIP